MSYRIEVNGGLAWPFYYYDDYSVITCKWLSRYGSTYIHCYRVSHKSPLGLIH